LAKSLIIYFQYNIESVYFFYSSPVFRLIQSVCPEFECLMTLTKCSCSEGC